MSTRILVTIFLYFTSLLRAKKGRRIDWQVSKLDICQEISTGQGHIFAKSFTEENDDDSLFNLFTFFTEENSFEYTKNIQQKNKKINFNNLLIKSKFRIIFKNTDAKFLKTVKISLIIIDFFKLSIKYFKFIFTKAINKKILFI